MEHDYNENSAVQEIVVKYATYPTWLKWVGGTFLYLSAINVLIYAFQIGIFIFEESLGLGLILFLTGIGLFALGAPVMLAFTAPSIILEQLDGQLQNGWEFFGKTILYFLGAILVPYLILIAEAFFVGLILS